MLKMLIIVFILLEIFSFAKSGHEEISHDGYTEILDNLAAETINSEDSLSSLQFQPAILDFLQRSIGDPRDEKVFLFNKHKNRKVHLGRITGSSSDFYSNYFEDKIIEPLANTSFKIVFLPRQLGETNSSLIIHTSFGDINYQVRGVGVECPYRLRPLIGIKLPLNATISPEIQIYNPHDFALQISEIYSSGGEFQLELPSQNSAAAANGQEGDYKLWEIPSFTSKPIIRVRFTASKTGNHTAYVRIKVATTLSMKEEKMLVVPIEIEVFNETGIYSEAPLLDFGMIGHLDGVRRYVYNLLNSGSSAINIKNWGIESEDEIVKSNSQCLSVDVVQFRKKNFTDHLAIEIDWSKCKNKLPHLIRGFVFLTADSTDTETDEVTYRIPFYGHVIEGNLIYNADDLKFLRSDKKTPDSPRTLVLQNRYNVPLAITNLSVPESCARYFKLSGFKSLILLPGESVDLLEIQSLAIQVAPNITTLQESFRIVTNVTFFDIPVWSFTGLLRRIVPVDFARERSQIDEKALNFGALLPVGKQSELLMAFVNENPIPIEISGWKGAITSGNGQAQISTINRGCSKMSLDDLVFCSSSVKSGEWIVFAISVQSHVVGTFGGNFLVKTPFEEINTPIKFSTAMGRLELKSKMVFDECFPGKICSVTVQAYSTFMKKMYVEGISVDMEGISYEFAVKAPHELPEILPNVDTDVGKLFFNPKEVLCKKRVTCYTTFDVLSRPIGETWMRTLTNYTDYSRWDNEQLRSQLSSFMDVKQNIKQMQFRLTTSQIRRYEFNATINFVWPRLMKGNVEFPFAQINQLETRFIDIFNPSDQPLFVHFVLHNTSLHGDKINVLNEAIHNCNNCVLSHEHPFSFNLSKDKEIFMDEVKPRSTLKVGINFHANLPGTYTTLLYLRNNLTIVEAVWLSARAVVPQFKFGNRKPGSETALNFEINEKHLKLCEKKVGGANVLISSKRTFTAKNAGEVPLTIYGIRIENDLCVGYGFKVLNCEPFELQPNESRKIEIGFSPDFTLSRVNRTLNFDTSIESGINFTLIGTVASPALEICSQNVMRPSWESDFKSKVAIVLCIALALVLVASAMDSERILKEHMKSIVRERGPLSAPLDLRKIGIDARRAGYDISVGITCIIPPPQERLNNLINHQTSLNNFRKRLTITKNLTALRNKLTGTKVLHNEPSTNLTNNTAKNTPPRPPSRPTEIMNNGTKDSNNKSKNNENTNNNFKDSSKKSEDDSISSSSSKENCEISSKAQKNTNQESPPLTKGKNSNKKSKNQLNINDSSSKDQKNCTQQQPSSKATVKPLNNNQNQNRVANNSKNKSAAISPTLNVKLTNGDVAVKSHSPTSNASSNEGHQSNHQHVNFMSDMIIADTNGGIEVNHAIKNDINSAGKQQPSGKYGKTPGRERKAPTNGTTSNINAIQNNNNNNNVKRVQPKDNKQFTFKQNLNSAFSNVSKLANNNVINTHHQNLYGANNWNNPSASNAASNNNGASIWNNNTSYSEVVSQPIEPKTQQSYGNMMNGFANGHREHDFTRTSTFNPMNDQSFNFDQDMSNSTQYGPIGTRKSPSSTPSWEPLNGGINQHIAKPSPYASSFFSSQPDYGMHKQHQQQQQQHQQSKLMHLMSYNDSNPQQQQQQQQQQGPTMDERYKYYLMLKERERQQQLEWMATVPVSSGGGSLWSASNWATPSPPPGFEQQFQQPIQIQQNHQQQQHPALTAPPQHQQHHPQQQQLQQQQSSLPAYDPFKSLSAIWNPSNRNENERDAWNQ